MMEKVGEHDQNILDEFTKNYKKKKNKCRFGTTAQ